MIGKENKIKKLKLMTIPDWENILVQKITPKSCFFSPQALEICIKIYSVRKLVATVINNNNIYS